MGMQVPHTRLSWFNGNWKHINATSFKLYLALKEEEGNCNVIHVATSQPYGQKEKWHSLKICFLPRSLFHWSSLPRDELFNNCCPIILEAKREKSLLHYICFFPCSFFHCLNLPKRISHSITFFPLQLLPLHAPTIQLDSTVLSLFTQLCSQKKNFLNVYVM